MVFFTDLDNTIIYSYKQDIGADKQCVEIYQGREISFITRETYRLLKEVRGRMPIIPVTTRTAEQYGRIDLGIGKFEYALVCNGGVLLAGGEEDRDWYRHSLELVGHSRDELLKAAALLEHEKRRCFELRFIKGLFVFTKCIEPEKVAEGLRGVLDVALVDVFYNGVKVYVVPKALSKGSAVRRFREYTGIEYAAAAGDSEFDISMLEACDYGIASRELAKSYGRFPENVVCPQAGKLFAVSALEMVLYWRPKRLTAQYNMMHTPT